MTSAEGLAAAEAQEKERKKQEARDKQLEQETERARLRTERDPNQPFVGTLASKKKDELQDVAWALGLPENGTKAEITDRINRYFNDNQQLKTDCRYEGLFTSGRNRTRSRPTSDKNTGASSMSSHPTNAPRYPLHPIPPNHDHDAEQSLQPPPSHTPQPHHTTNNLDGRLT